MKTSDAHITTTQTRHKTSESSPFFDREQGAGQLLMDQSNTSASWQSHPIQAKLTIGAPNDSFEKEADTTADKVVQRISMRDSSSPSYSGDGYSGIMPALTVSSIGTPVRAKSIKDDKSIQREEQREEDQPVQEKIQRKPIFESAADPPEEEGTAQRKPWGPIQRKCANCEAEEQGSVQRSSSGDAGATAAPSSFTSKLSSTRGGGAPLPEDTRTEMEGAFGADFSSVRIHTGSNAADMSQSIEAKAFTHGSDIYFNDGAYNPQSTDGKHLIAHELTHTVQQGASVRAKLNVSTSGAPKIQRVLGWIKDKIMSGLNWAAERLIPGYSLLNVILGRNLITDKPVERSGVNIIRAYMRLIPVIGSVLLSQLEETDTLTEAGTWAEQQVKKFGINFDDIAKRLTTMWDEMSAWRGVNYNVRIFKRYIGPVLGKFLAFSSVVSQKCKELRFEGALRLVGANELLTQIKKSPAAFKKIVDNPTIILSNFMRALKMGFTKFMGNFGKHFKNALFGWLFGKAAAMGIQMPKTLDVPGLFHLVAQLLGLTFPQIKALVLQKIGPKGRKVFEFIEKSVAVVKRVITEGPIALWDMVKEYLTNLKEMIFSQITTLVTGEIIKVAITKLVSMLNPAGAIVQLVLTLYRVIKFFIDNWSTIKDIAIGVISSITKVALGQLGPAAGFVEQVMAKGMQLVISFLARIFGLSGIAEKVKKLIKKISAPVIKARDKVVEWLVKKGKALLRRLFGRGNGGGRDNNTIKSKSDLFTEVGKEIGKRSAIKKEDNKMSREEAESVAQSVKKDYNAVVKSIKIHDSEDNWRFEYIQRATKDEPKSDDTTTSNSIGYHGTNGDNILSIIGSGSMRPSDGKIFISTNRATFQHGTDSTRGAAFVVKIKLTYNPTQVKNEQTSKFGNPLTQIFHTDKEIQADVLELHVKRQLREDGEPTGRFKDKIIRGKENIIAYLNGGWSNDENEWEE